MDLFIFIATGWGAVNGGINAFNYDLVRACSDVAKTDKHTKVCCVVPSLTEQEQTEMRDESIIPVTISKEAFSSPEAANLILNNITKNTLLRPFFPKQCNTFCVGHDIYTGNLSKQLADACDGWNVVFHHMDYESYYLFKNNDPKAYKQKVTAQKDALCNADLVCAVGPKLTDSASGITRSKENISVLEVYPGIAEFNAIKKLNPRFRPITFGRIEADNQRIKQTELAVVAFAKAISLDSRLEVIGEDPSISVIGYDKDTSLEEEVKRLQEKTEKIAGRLCIVNPVAYLNRDQLEETIREASVVMMLSFHEGFGLVGYESIAAGVPLILSKNSGLYQLRYC